MGFRTIVISNRCKLDYSLNYLICRKLQEEKRVLIDEIKLLIIETTQVSITTCLISELCKKQVKIIFCDEKHNPVSEVVPYYNNFYSYRKIKEQINIHVDNKDYLWKLIIKEKINNQARNIEFIGAIDQYKMLKEYQQNVENGDVTNREGHSAKVYFNCLFGKDFSRTKDLIINNLLNYGYSILLSLINREIKCCGYLTEIGIHHIGESNQFNLSCDFIEPLRPLVDLLVIKEIVNEENYKSKFVEMISKNVHYNGKDIFLDNAIHLYVEDLIRFLKTGEVDSIRFIEYEL